MANRAVGFVSQLRHNKYRKLVRCPAVSLATARSTGTAGIARLATLLPSYHLGGFVLNYAAHASWVQPNDVTCTTESEVKVQAGLLQPVDTMESCIIAAELKDNSGTTLHADC